MILTETAVYLLRNSRPGAPSNHGRAGLSHYTAFQLLRSIHRLGVKLARLAEDECNLPSFGPRQEVQRARAQRKIVQLTRELCGRRVKVAFAGDPRGWVVRFHDYTDNPERDQPRGGY